jgi:hypothetical protein
MADGERKAGGERMFGGGSERRLTTLSGMPFFDLRTRRQGVILEQLVAVREQCTHRL